MSDDPSSSPIEPFRPLPDPTWRERVQVAVERVRSLDRVARTGLALAATALAVVVGVVLLRPAGADPAPEDTLPRCSPTARRSTFRASARKSLLMLVQLTRRQERQRSSTSTPHRSRSSTRCRASGRRRRKRSSTTAPSTDAFSRSTNFSTSTASAQPSSMRSARSSAYDTAAMPHAGTMLTAPDIP